MIAKSGIEMKSTGLPIGLLFAIALISIGFCTSNISRKREWSSFYATSLIFYFIFLNFLFLIYYL